MLSQGAFEGLRKKIDYSEYGGAPLLGVRGVSVIGHGRSNPARSKMPSASPQLARAANERKDRTGAFSRGLQPDRSVNRARSMQENGTEMGKIAFLFPGQASQYPGMGKELAEKFPVAKAVFDEADAALGFSISKLCFEGTEEELKLTENTQPAILTVSVAAYRVSRKGNQPDFVAGHSLGEYSALVAAGSLNFADAVKIVRERGTIHAGSCARRRRRHGRDHGLAPCGSAGVCKQAAE